MSDRELLELAAKAAGIEIVEWREDIGQAFIQTEFWKLSWNPLADDGDALRLAIACKITDLSKAVGEMLLQENIEGDDVNMLVRRAIVRAAAKVGEGMLTHDEFILMFPDRFPDESVKQAAAASGQTGGENGN